MNHGIDPGIPEFSGLSTRWVRRDYGVNSWGRVTHICVSKQTSIGSDNGLSPGRRQAIIWTNAGILLIWPLGTNFSEIPIEIHILSFKKMHLKMSSGKWRPFCLGLNGLNIYTCFALTCNWLITHLGLIHLSQLHTGDLVSFLSRFMVLSSLHVMVMITNICFQLCKCMAGLSPSHLLRNHIYQKWWRGFEAVRFLKIFTSPSWHFSLQRRHNERGNVSNHQRLHCLLNCWFRHRSKKTSKLRVIVLCAGNSSRNSP